MRTFFRHDGQIQVAPSKAEKRMRGSTTCGRSAAFLVSAEIRPAELLHI